MTSSTHHRVSYWKTILLVSFAALVCVSAGLLIATWFSSWSVFALIVSGLLALPLLIVVMGGVVVLHRDSMLSLAQRDWFHAANESRTEDGILRSAQDFGLGLRRFFRNLLGGRALLVGDMVEVRSRSEIEQTLDKSGALDGLPFMPEMIQFCGQKIQVFRRVDKVYDYGGAKVVRRLKNAVLLRHTRCDGNAHGSCQAACYLMWKESWLRRVPDSVQHAAPVAVQSSTTSPDASDTAARDAFQRRFPQIVVEPNAPLKFKCQFTELVKSSTSLHPADIRQDFRPLLAGNVTVKGFVIVLLTRAFNYVQGLRGGISFPAMSTSGATSTPSITRTLMPGEQVKVAPMTEIALTLNKSSKNRGLWFDRDMVKHCGHEYRVLRRVDRIIDDANKQMRDMKTPCIVLDGVNYSGEFLRFCAQEENLYWREAWLHRTSEASGEIAAAAQIEAAVVNSVERQTQHG